MSKSEVIFWWVMLFWAVFYYSQSADISVGFFTYGGADDIITTIKSWYEFFFKN
jgi:hypothetical protein